MALTPGLILRQTQSLAMTPQLMQSIRLLQMTQAELAQFIAEEVERNPLLELGPRESEAEPDRDIAPDRAERLTEAFDTGLDNVFPDDAPVQKPDAPELIAQWKSMPGRGAGTADYDIDDFLAGEVSLRDHLERQIPFLLPEGADRLAARYLVDQLDPSGYFDGDIVEIAARLGRPDKEVEALLKRLQGLDPPGIFARSLGECLAIQLQRRDRLDPAMAALLCHLDLLARRDFAALRRLCGVDDEDLIAMLAEIRSLDPKPGSRFDSHFTETVSADIIVRAGAKGGWSVELAPDRLPRLIVNHAYFREVSQTCGGSEPDRRFLADCLQNANWLTRSLDQRARTMLKVAAEIVRQQDGFLRHGIDHLRPLTLKAVAGATGLHESTVSRVTANKFMLTPRGLFDLRYFFTVPIAATGDGSHSAETVRHRIRQMVAGESPDAVLSDDDIMLELKREGIEIARRTVAKYREAMGISSSVQRRREKRALAKAGAS